MASSKYDLDIDKNSDYKVTFTFTEDDDTPLDLSSFEAIFIARIENRTSSEILFVADRIERNQNEVILEVFSKTSKDVIPLKGYYNLILKNGIAKDRTIEGNINFTRSIDDS